MYLIGIYRTFHTKVANAFFSHAQGTFSRIENVQTRPQNKAQQI